MKNEETSVEQYLIEVILHERNDFRAKMLRSALRGLSVVFKALVQGRIALFKHRIRRETHLGTAVISIGNLTVGGTGKTPVVEMFAKTLAESGRNVAILSRGYKSRKPPLYRRLLAAGRNETKKLEINPPRVVSDGNSVDISVRDSGDEPYMLAKNLAPQNVKVVVDRDRVKCGEYAIKKFKVDTLILDDGLQYLKLHHRLDIVLVDSNHPFGNGRLLPSGTLREPQENLRRASYIFLTKCTPGEDTTSIHQQLRKHNQRAEIIDCTHQPIELVDMRDGKKYPLSLLNEARVGAISGIAQPKSFEKGLQRLGAQVELYARHADHHFYSKNDVKRFLNRSINRDVDFVVTTEKDAVRFPPVSEHDIPVYFLRIEIRILSGTESWDECVRRICSPHYRLPAHARY